MIDEKGDLTEFVLWRVPRAPQHPEGIRYRLAFVPAGRKRPAVLYDNHHPKGHHRHWEGREEPYPFVSVDRLVADFRADSRRVKLGPKERGA